MDMYFPYLSPNSKRLADAVFWRGLCAGLCSGESAVMERIRPSASFGLDAGAVSFQPFPLRNALLAMPAASGNDAYPGRSDYLADNRSDPFDVAASRSVAEHNTNGGILSALCLRSAFVFDRNAPLLPAPY